MTRRMGRARGPAWYAGLIGVGVGALAWPSGASAPPGSPVVQVVELWSGEMDGRAEALTNALRDVVLEGDAFLLNTDNPQLIPTAQDAKCDAKAFTGPLREDSGKGLLAKGCQARMAKRLGAKGGLFWGYLYPGPGGRRLAQVHLWRPGEERTATLAYEDKERRRVAERLYRHLVYAGKMGDVRVVGGAGLRGELVVNGQSEGVYEGGELALTVAVGEASAEVRAGEKVVARGRAMVTATGAASELRLEVEAEPAPPPPPVARVEPVAPRPPPSGGPSALPWVVGGVGAAGLVGAGVLFGLRQSERGDLGDRCASSKCLPEERTSIDRADRYGTLSLLSLGVGVVGVGAATYLFLSEAGSGSATARGPRVIGSAGPTAGGAFVGVAGSF
jgi:hypothetical protein